jgi:DNA-directed RNA polymerase specialized sigma24 family protein
VTPSLEICETGRKVDPSPSQRSTFDRFRGMVEAGLARPLLRDGSMDKNFDQPEVLEDLRSGDPAREGQALRALIEHLVAQTSRDLATRRNGVHLQPDSLVQRVVMRELYETGAPYQKFENDSHLFGRLRLGILNRIREVLRSPRARARQFSQSEPEAGPFDPKAEGAGPRTEIARKDWNAHADERNAASRARILAIIAEEDRALVELVVFRGLGSERAGEQLGMHADAVRQRMSRQRRRLREALLAPLDAKLSAADATVVKGLLVERREPSELAGEVGLSVESIARRLAELLAGPIAAELGDEGVTYLMRLLGKVRGPGPGPK